MAGYTPIDFTDIITVEPGKRYGKHCIRDLPVTVGDVLGQLAAGMSEEEILNHFPDLTGKDIKACLAFVADRKRRFALVPLGAPGRKRHLMWSASSSAEYLSEADFRSGA